MPVFITRTQIDFSMCKHTHTYSIICMYTFAHIRIICMYSCACMYCANAYPHSENMPKLQPRYYSVASSPLVSRHQFKIVFNIIELPVREWNKAKRYLRMYIYYYVSWCGGKSWVDQRVPQAYIHHVALLL